MLFEGFKLKPLERKRSGYIQEQGFCWRGEKTQVDMCSMSFIRVFIGLYCLSLWEREREREIIKKLVENAVVLCFVTGCFWGWRTLVGRGNQMVEWYWSCQTRVIQDTAFEWQAFFIIIVYIQMRVKTKEKLLTWKDFRILDWLFGLWEVGGGNTGQKRLLNLTRFLKARTTCHERILYEVTCFSNWMKRRKKHS